METFKFKGYDYTIVNVGSKSKFNEIYEKLLTRYNKKKSIVKDLENAYRVSPTELYLIRFDEKRHSIIPVRISKESVDGHLMKDRYDERDRKIQAGIGAEMSRHSNEIYEAVEKKHKMMDTQKEISERQRQAEQIVLDGGNFRRIIEIHYKTAKKIPDILLTSDYRFSEDRDYKSRIELQIERIIEKYDLLTKRMDEIDRDPNMNLNIVKNLFPKDINTTDSPDGFVVLLETYCFLGLFNNDIVKDWTTLRDYTIDSKTASVNVKLKIEKVFLVMQKTTEFLHAMESILYPDKIGAARNTHVVYDVKLFTEDVIKILSGKRKQTD